MDLESHYSMSRNLKSRFSANTQFKNVNSKIPFSMPTNFISPAVSRKNLKEAFIHLLNICRLWDILLSILQCNHMSLDDALLFLRLVNKEKFEVILEHIFVLDRILAEHGLIENKFDPKEFRYGHENK